MTAELFVFEVHLSNQVTFCLGIALLDRATGQTRMLFRTDLRDLADADEDVEILSAYPEMIETECRRRGLDNCLRELSQTLSHTVRLLGPHHIEATDIDTAFERQAAIKGLQLRNQA